MTRWLFEGVGAAGQPRSCHPQPVYKWLVDAGGPVDDIAVVCVRARRVARSALNNIHGQPADRGLLVLGMHIHPGLPHRFNSDIQ